MDEKITLKGYIGRKIFDDARTYNKGYKIYAFYPNNDCAGLVTLNEYGNISIKGILPDLIEGKEYLFECVIKNDGRYGLSYEVTNMSCDRDEKISVEETIKFLSQLSISHKVIENIIETCPNIIDLIISDKVDEIPLEDIKGLREKRLGKIVEKVNENYKFFDIMTEYADFGLSMTMVKELYDKYTSVEMIRKHMDSNPYECLCQIARVGFKTADARIITKNESLKTSPFRMLECIKYLLKENEEKGNTWINISELHKLAIETTPECIKTFVTVMKNDKSIYIDMERKRVCFTKTYVCEFEIACRLIQLSLHKKTYRFDTDKYTKSAEGFELSIKQRVILPYLKENSICVLSGFAGTGKSTSVKAVVDMLDDYGKTVMLLAPTGRASKVLANMTKKDASTIHRGLRLGTEDEYNEENPVTVDFVLCDEASMIDIWLMRKLLRAINPARTTLLFICDPEQLASVGAGNVIQDIIQSKTIPTIFLDEVFRYGEGGLSFIATEIRNGRKFLDEDCANITNFGKNKDYSFVKTPKENTLSMMMMIYKRMLANGMDRNDVIVLSAYNKGEFGTYNINNIIQAYVNPKLDDEEDIFTRVVDKVTIAFRVGDKVIQTKNNYKANLYLEDRSQIRYDKKGREQRPTTKIFNGDDGIVEKIDGDLLVVNFYGELVEYEKNQLNSLLLGYAISTHKSQGSTYDNAIVVSPTSHKFFTKRNLLYVAVTRARKKVFHVGDVGTVNYALKQSENILRNTFLYDLLILPNLQDAKIEVKSEETGQEEME